MDKKKSKKPLAKRSRAPKKATKPTKKKKNYPVAGDQPSTGNYNYNSSNIFGGGDTY